MYLTCPYGSMTDRTEVTSERKRQPYIKLYKCNISNQVYAHHQINNRYYRLEDPSNMNSDIVRWVNRR